MNIAGEMNVIKKDIVRKLSEDSSCYKIPQTQISDIITKALEIITESLVSGEDVLLRGFGHFKVRYHAPREINHPSTKEKIMSPPKNVILFESARNVKRKLRIVKSGTTNNEV